MHELDALSPESLLIASNQAFIATHEMFLALPSLELKKDGDNHDHDETVTSELA